MLNVNFPPEINNFTSTQEDILKILVQRLFRLKASAQGGNGEDEKKKKIQMSLLGTRLRLLIPALDKQRQEDLPEFEANVGYRMSPCSVGSCFEN